MAIEGFDYKGFAASMAEQAQGLVPANLQDHEKAYIVKTLGNFTLLAGEALYNDTSLNLNLEQATFITQIIAEWSFHKSIDLVHSGILPQYWDGIMQKIAFTIFEVAKQAILRKIPQEQLLQAVEHHVIKVYNQSIEELQEKGIIDENTKNNAEKQSNIDAMAQQAQQEQQAQQQEEAAKRKQALVEQSERNMEEAEKRREQGVSQQRPAQRPVSAPEGITHKQLKLMSLAMVLKILSQDKVTTILNKFDAGDSKEIAKYMDMADLESIIDGDLVTDCLKEIKSFLPLKKKLSPENVVADISNLYQQYPREKIETIIKHERPFVKRFIAQASDGEYGNLPLKVAGIITEYLCESVNE